MSKTTTHIRFANEQTPSGRWSRTSSSAPPPTQLSLSAGVTYQSICISESESRYIIDTFRHYDRSRLYDDYKHSTDQQKLRDRARQAQQELEDLLARDREVLEGEEGDEDERKSA